MFYRVGVCERTGGARLWRVAVSREVRLALLLSASMSSACSESTESALPTAGSGRVEQPAPAAEQPAGSAAQPASAAAPLPGPASPVAGGEAGDPALLGVQGSSGVTAADGGAPAGASSAPAGGSAGDTAVGADGTAAADCGLPPTVSFRTDVQPFLIASCGGGSGCHVIDAASTMGSGGFNHAYDWATAGAHTSSCPDGPLRFEVLVDVSVAANPPTCTKSRQMPPPDATGAGQRAPLTRCQIAALQAWLDEPKVVQNHRPDDSSPAAPYAMPPFN
jgi:hypothetical protein